MLEILPQQATAGYNSGPPQQTYYWGSGLLMEYSLEQMFWLPFFGVSIRHHLFWEIRRLWEFQKNGTQKVKEKASAKERVKGLSGNLSPQATAGHNSGPPQQTYYWGSGLLMEYSLSEWVSERVSEWASERVSERASEWVSECVSERASERVSEWVSERVWGSEGVREEGREGRKDGAHT